MNDKTFMVLTALGMFLMASWHINGGMRTGKEKKEVVLRNC